MLPTGGLYIAGGLAPKLLARLRPVVAAAYVDDGLMGDFIARHPLYVITNEHVGLLGAFVRAKRLIADDDIASA